MKPTFRGVRQELDPGERAVGILAGERLTGLGPLDGLVDVAPEMEAPAVVVARRPLVVDHGVVRVAATARRRLDRRRPTAVPDVGVEVAGCVAHDGLERERRCPSARPVVS